MRRAGQQCPEDARREQHPDCHSDEAEEGVKPDSASSTVSRAGTASSIPAQLLAEDRIRRRAVQAASLPI
jgi:hypothetical protein